MCVRVSIITLFEWFCDWILELFWQCGMLLLSFYETFFGYLKIMSNFTWSKQYSKTEKSTKLLQLHFIHGCWHLGFFNTWRFGRLETDWSVKNLTLDLTSYSISIDVSVTPNKFIQYNIMWKNFVTDLWQVSGFFRFPPHIKLTVTI